MTPLLSDALWSTVEPLLPSHPASPKGGAPRCDDRRCLEGILYVLRGGIAWRLLPAEFGVSSSTCWRRFHEWTLVGVWDEVHRKLLRELGQQGKLDTRRVVIDSASVRALKGGRTPAPIRRTAPSQAVSGT
jgi:transposase